MKNHALKKLTDKLAEYVITVSGVAVIAAMFVMLALIVREALPLFLPAGQSEVGVSALPAGVGADDVAALAVEGDMRERARTVGVILRDGRGGFSTVNSGENGGAAAPFEFSRLPGAPESAGVRSVARHGNREFSVLWENGTAALYALSISFQYGGDGSATAEPSFRRVFGVEPDAGRSLPLFALLRGDADAHRAVFVYADGTVAERSAAPAKGLANRGKTVESAKTVTLPPRFAGADALTAAALNDEGRLYLGTAEGSIVSVHFAARGGEAAVEVTPAFRDRRALTSLSFLTGGGAIAVGDSSGEVSVWFPRREEGEFRLRRSVGWEAEGGGAIAAIAPSGRDRGFMALDAEGGIRWLYSTNGRELLRMPPPQRDPAERTVALAMNERADNLAALRADGGIVFHALDASYPEAGWAGFFTRLFYEGYEEAAFVWQSTGAEGGEQKLSLVPIIWGSLKAAVYALFFATPIALAAAMYLSQFAAPHWRARLKPAVEMLAAVPSVVIGFLAALWLAPLLERHIGFVARYWPYDQRNSLVIAIAMGFAVIPTVFSLAEDAISAVPPSLSAASLALGASKWQTVLRVVLPTASPGIFTAVMLGFGRAVGETMIVLMAAGNTPVLSLSPFNGMRTLSANIAVEMPEAPVGGTLYRTLFFCALILFVMTFVINTAAEVFRHRLRRRYGRI